MDGRSKLHTKGLCRCCLASGLKKDCQAEQGIGSRERMSSFVLNRGDSSCACGNGKGEEGGHFKGNRDYPGGEEVERLLLEYQSVPNFDPRKGRYNGLLLFDPSV